MARNDSVATLYMVTRPATGVNFGGGPLGHGNQWFPHWRIGSFPSKSALIFGVTICNLKDVKRFFMSFLNLPLDATGIGDDPGGIGVVANKRNGRDMNRPMNKTVKKVTVDDASRGAAPRVAVGWKVGMRTFGTKNYFSFTAKDISTSGILLKVDDPRVQAPFQKRTLLEIVVYPDGQLIKEEISVTAVVVRTQQSACRDRFKEEFGIRVVDAPESFAMAVGEALMAA
jgi:PilZ domain